jgi:hypothetical protein
VWINSLAPALSLPTYLIYDELDPGRDQSPKVDVYDEFIRVRTFPKGNQNGFKARPDFYLLSHLPKLPLVILADGWQMARLIVDWQKM